MEITKIVAGLCASLLVFLLISWAAESMVLEGEAHGGEHHNAYPIEVPEGGDSGEPEVEVAAVDIMEMMPTAEAAAGEKLFRPCAACHKIEEGGKGSGPYLYGIVGRDVASVDGFSYSAAMQDLPGEWTEQMLSEFLTNPKAYLPGTKMSFKGIKDPMDRANVIAYLESLNN